MILDGCPRLTLKVKSLSVFEDLPVFTPLKMIDTEDHFEVTV
jgi:hypothetical protein